MKKSLWDNSNLQKEIKWDNIPVKGVEGDNTNVANPNYPKKALKPGGNNDLLSTDIIYKRVCVKIPAGLVKEFQMKIREFKQEKGLSTIPFGVYDIKK